MATEREHLKTWMAENSHDATSLQKAMGMYFSIKYMVSGSAYIHDGFRYRFRDTFGDAAFAQVFGVGDNERLAQYAAQQAVLKAIAKKKLAPANSHKCVGCSNHAQCFHHESYAPEHRLCVVPLCYKCHRRHHTGRARLDFGIAAMALGIIRIAFAPEPHP